MKTHVNCWNIGHCRGTQNVVDAINRYAETHKLEYVARISYGKDSLKMLDVIVSRGLPLDRITTSDVWATDTISACLPPVEEFKAKMDEVIWKKYRIEVEHLCARNPDGSKKTYEQMFYDIPQRKPDSKKVLTTEQFSDSQLSVVNGVKHLNGVSMIKIQGTIRSFPGTVKVPWCQKLKDSKYFIWSPRLRTLIKI